LVQKSKSKSSSRERSIFNTVNTYAGNSIANTINDCTSKSVVNSVDNSSRTYMDIFLILRLLYLVCHLRKSISQHQDPQIDLDNLTEENPG
jgi:hypothetical protein